ncbi:MAG: GNVR domain-containing protein [Burkholderiaceae bacterium]
MSLPQILQILLARYRLVAGAALAGLAIALVATLVLPKSWRATAEVYVDLGAPDAVSGATAPHAALAAQVSTQADLIASLRVAEAVVRARGLERDPDAQAQWRKATGGHGQLVNWLANQLLEDLDVQADAKGNLVRVSMRANTPQEAAALANAFVDAYLQTALALRSDPARANAEFFAAGVETAMQRLAAAKQRLSEYQMRHGVLEVENTFDVENERLAELSRQLAAVQSQAAGARARGSQGQESLPEVLADPVVQKLRDRLAAAQAEFTAIQGRLGSAHPQYRAQQAQVNSLSRQLRQETERRRGSVQVADKVSQEQVATLEREFAAQRDKVLSLKTHRDQIDLLRNDEQAAQKAYELVAQRSAVSALESTLRQTNVSVLTPAVAPIKPDSPKPALNLVVGLVLGALVGIASALARESSRPMVRSAQVIDETLGLPVLTTLPSSRAGKPGARSRGRAVRSLPALVDLVRLPGKRPA